MTQRAGSLRLLERLPVRKRIVGRAGLTGSM
jgi:hypothetical protein